MYIGEDCADFDATKIRSKRIAIEFGDLENKWVNKKSKKFE